MPRFESPAVRLSEGLHCQAASVTVTGGPSRRRQPEGPAAAAARRHGIQVPTGTVRAALAAAARRRVDSESGFRVRDRGPG